MRTKMVVSIMALLLLSVPAMAVKETGSLDAPVLESITIITDANGDSVFLDWTDVNDAVKYSVDIKGSVEYFDSNSTSHVTVDVKLSFGTSDRTDGKEMGESDLAIAKDDLCASILDALAELGVNLDFVGDLEFIATGKVKALDPGKDKGRQNNPFSNSLDLPAIICTN